MRLGTPGGQGVSATNSIACSVQNSVQTVRSSVPGSKSRESRSRGLRVLVAGYASGQLRCLLHEREAPTFTAAAVARAQSRVDELAAELHRAASSEQPTTTRRPAGNGSPTMIRLASVDVTTLATTVPTGDDGGMRRMQKLAARDEDLQAHGRHGWAVCTTVVIAPLKRDLPGEHLVALAKLVRNVLGGAMGTGDHADQLAVLNERERDGRRLTHVFHELNVTG